MRIHDEGLTLPVSDKFILALDSLLADKMAKEAVTQESEVKAVTFNFLDPTYSSESGGFHPVEIRLERRCQRKDRWHFCYITDFAYVGSGPYAELTKELDFDFQAGIFQNLFGVFPIEQVTDMYQLWESNFLYYWQQMHVFDVCISLE